jgi:hypothetical protein
MMKYNEDILVFYTNLYGSAILPMSDHGPLFTPGAGSGRLE